MMDILFLLAGLVLILVGAHILTDGASAVANRFHISPLVIGLTIVAFGTSAPELTVSIVSALQGSSDLAIGNVIGSNIFNTLMIVGCTAVITPVHISKGTLIKEIPLCILASFALIVCANDVFFNKETVNVISRSDGLLLLCFFLIFLSYTFAIARNNTAEDIQVKTIPLWKSVLFIVLGFVALVYGGEFFVESASGIARSVGVSDSVIAITLVATGTSLPELATSAVAAWKKNSEIAIGNVIGSNLFNIFLVVGTSATIAPMHIQGITPVDYGVFIFSCILLFTFGWLYKKRIISRVEGGLLLACYVGYIVYLLIHA